MPAKIPRMTARRVGLWALTLATALVLTRVMAQAVRADGASLLDAGLIVLFFVLTTWVALWFWIAAIGSCLASRRPRGAAEPAAPRAPLPGRTAILTPVYNEDPRGVFARVLAMANSLEAAGALEAFDFFVLSDTTKADVWVEEERQWLGVQGLLPRGATVFYRRRRKNTRRKAGNIADFCERWGADYPLMVVLDADSLVEGAVLVELVRRMEADPELGLLQTPTLPLGQESLLSRCQQFAAKLCIPLLAEGLDWFSGDGGNYWGHNAIIRTAAFTRHCGLSDLPGAAPLGGEILSHDFVEAALMRRAGYKVRLACDLTASYEQTPPTLPAFAMRDQRWCQGNMQHARLVVSRDIPATSRFHFATGVMAYASSPLWLAFLLLGGWGWFADAERAGGLSTPHTVAVFVAVMTMLAAPRALGALVALRGPGGWRGFGGAGRLMASLLAEFAISVLLAPIMMAFHTLFVLSTLAGRKVEWHAQNRSDAGVTLWQAVQVHRGQMLAGVVVTAALAALAPEALPWLAPVLAGLVLAIPLSMAVSNARWGRRAKLWGLLRVPEEVRRPPIVRRCEFEAWRLETLAARQPPALHQLLSDPSFLRSHLASLAAPGAGRAPRASRADVRAVAECAVHNAWGRATEPQKHAVLNDPAALAVLHRYVWRQRALQLANPAARRGQRPPALAATAK
jgi:membrane glycosyltransferase